MLHAAGRALTVPAGVSHPTYRALGRLSDILVAVLLSTVQDPTTFNDFTTSSRQQQFARNLASGFWDSELCIPLDLDYYAGFSGFANVRVTARFLVSGGDGSLYQCADLTLSKSFMVPSGVSCSNGTSTGSSSPSASASGSSGAPSASLTSSDGNGVSNIATTGFSV